MQHLRLLTWMVGLAVVGALVVAVVWRGNALDGDGGGSASDSGPVHVHALGVNPADDALFIATHTGLYRVGREDERAQRVDDRDQDTMGFTVVGPNRFLGSGHPDLRDDLPSHLGLIESVDAGGTWDSVSLLGQADFHVLRRAGSRVYGYDASNERLLVSKDDGRTWQERPKPGPVLDLVVSPDDPKRILVTSIGVGASGLFESRDDGRSWERLSGSIGLLAWPTSARLYVLSGTGDVLTSTTGGSGLVRRGEIGGQPAAFLAEAPGELFAALHDGTIKWSRDGGATWAVRSTP